MKNMKGCTSTQIHQISISKNRRHPSAGTFYTSSAGAVISLILMGITAFVFSLTGATNLFGLNGSASATTSTITLSVTGGIGVSVMPSDNGTFASSTATNNVSVKTNSASGYELGIKASTSGSNNNALINTTDSSKIIPSITESVSEADYSDASYASSHNLNNTWGFKPSKLNSVANTNYIPGPTDTVYPIVIDKTTTANPSTFNDYTITLGTRIDNTQTPGSYANTFVITAVANPTPYSITYNKNTTDTVTNMPQNVSSDTFSDQVNLSNLVPARDGFNFKGWCTVQVADGGTCTGTTYNPDGGGTSLTWTLDQTAASNSLSIYAMWEISFVTFDQAFAKAGKTKQGNYYKMQDATASICTAVTTGQIGQLIDTRDSTVYTVGKLADNKCWMLDNLRLGATNITTNLTSSNTNLSTTITASTWNGYRKTSGFTSYTAPMFNSASADNTTTSYGSGSGKIGVYYNYCAASAKTYCYASGKGTGNASYDVCPAGWRMPTGSTGEYKALYTAYSSNDTKFRNAFSATLSGYFSYNSAVGQGSEGNFWSSTMYGGDRMYSLSVSSGSVTPAYKYYRDSGYSVRCILK